MAGSVGALPASQVSDFTSSVEAEFGNKALGRLLCGFLAWFVVLAITARIRAGIHPLLTDCHSARQQMVNRDAVTAAAGFLLATPTTFHAEYGTRPTRTPPSKPVPRLRWLASIEENRDGEKAVRNRKARKELARRLQSENPGLEVVHPHAAGIDVLCFLARTLPRQPHQRR
jgi:hypothetical protein